MPIFERIGSPSQQRYRYLRLEPKSQNQPHFIRSEIAKVLARQDSQTLVMTVCPSCLATKFFTALAGAAARWFLPMKCAARLCFCAYVCGWPFVTGIAVPSVRESSKGDILELLLKELVWNERLLEEGQLPQLDCKSCIESVPR